MTEKRDVTALTHDGRESLFPFTFLRRAARFVTPRILWTVIGRGDRAEFVIWRQWLGHAYDINSIVSAPGRYDRETRFGECDPMPFARRKHP